MTTQNPANAEEYVRHAALFDLNYEIKCRRNQLTVQALNIKERMERVLAKLEDEKSLTEMHVVNALGELQSQGSEFDRLCGEFESLKQVRKAVESALR